MGKEKKLRRNMDHLMNLARICSRLRLYDWNKPINGNKWGTYGYLDDIEALCRRLYRGKRDEKLAAAEEIERRNLWWILDLDA
jgi:hypothetical protein